MNSRKDLGPQLQAIQERLGAARGKEYWRSLEELADSPEFREMMRAEFPEQADVWPDALSRRQFMTLMGASLALAGVSGCSVRPAPSVGIRPYVRQPEEIVTGKPLFFATAMSLGAGAIGLLVESHEGRPTKIEGNPDHPASLGATDRYAQASVLTLYDPDRAQTVALLGQTSTWDAAFGRVPVNGVRSIGSSAKELRERHGAGLRILTETVTSPTLGRQLQDLLKKYPEARWHQYEPVNGDMAFRGAHAAFGQPVNTYYRLHQAGGQANASADVVLSLDADFLDCGPANVRYVADFMARRRVRTSQQNAAEARMNRLYVVESMLSTTGAKADHRLVLPSREIEGCARAIAARLGVAGAGSTSSGANENWIAAVAEDLQAHRGRCVVIPGERQPPAVHALAHAMNEHLGNNGKTVIHTDPIEVQPVDQTQSLRQLVEDMDGGKVDTLVILGGNPAFTAPADFNFAERMQKVPLGIHLGLFQDETSLLCHWHLPEAHYIETWGDTRAFDGTVTIAQPLIEPLYHGRAAHEVLSVILNDLRVPSYELVRTTWRTHWQQQGSKGNFEDFWDEAVHDGVVAGTQLQPRDLRVQQGWEKAPAAPSEPSTGFEIVFQPDPTIYDGRFANNGWLQELPKPITKLTWDNAVLMSPTTARQLGVGRHGYEHGGEHGGYRVDIVEVELGGRKVRGPAWEVPGHADNSIAIALGYGREAAGKVGGSKDQPVGFNAYLLRTSDRPWIASAATVRKTGDLYPLACTQGHQLIENRDIVRSAKLAEFQAKPDLLKERDKQEKHEEGAGLEKRMPLTLYEPWDYRPPKKKWGMAIDLTTCVGCNACVVACQSENNIPVVGKDQVLAGREMHWLRVDRYNQGPYDAPKEFFFQPLPCMHCENAPCEYVCPVAATVHSSDGLNDMVYNRCVGTRFCQNNCPYKVRRFNFFFYADYATQSVRQQYNPDVTVRSRGVMEKCTYCVQRIRHAEIGAQVEGRPIRDGDVLTACQAACPAQAIVFGDMNDPHSTVKAWKESPLEYGLLTELNTAPRTTYLAALRNPNPKLEPK
jgi:molybdopterin-containing oxidoreductase family iron-sulfur binding subunit